MPTSPAPPPTTRRSSSPRSINPSLAIPHRRFHNQQQHSHRSRDPAEQETVLVEIELPAAQDIELDILKSIEEDPAEQRARSNAQTADRMERGDIDRRIQATLDAMISSDPRTNLFVTRMALKKAPQVFQRNL